MYHVTNRRLHIPPHYLISCVSAIRITQGTAPSKRPEAMSEKKVAKRPRKVLVAMDGSKHADQAFEWYVKNAYKSDDEVFLAFCGEHSGEYPATALLASNPSVLDSIAEEHELRVQEALMHMEDLAKKLKIKHELHRLHGYVGDAVVQAAADFGVDFIVCGSRGQGAIRRTVFGSNSDYIIHHSHIPVMVCKHEDEHHKLGVH